MYFQYIRRYLELLFKTEEEAVLCTEALKDVREGLIVRQNIQKETKRKWI